jgi:hypothetical protein
MSYRSLLYTARGISREVNHRFRKFQKSKLPTVVLTPAKTKIIEVEVPVDDNQT